MQYKSFFTNQFELSKKSDLFWHIGVVICVIRLFLRLKLPPPPITWIIIHSCVYCHMFSSYYSFVWNSYHIDLMNDFWLLFGFLYVLSDYSSGWNSYHIDHMNDFWLLCGLSYVLSSYSSGWNSYHIDYMNGFSLLCGLSYVLSDYSYLWNSYHTDYMNDFYSCVGSHMCYQSTALAETLTTLITWMFFTPVWVVIGFKR